MNGHTILLLGAVIIGALLGALSARGISTAVAAQGPVREVTVNVTAGPRFGAPRALFEDSYGFHVTVRAYDVAPDGRRFLCAAAGSTRTPPVTSINLALNGFEELQRLVPTK